MTEEDRLEDFMSKLDAYVALRALHPAQPLPTYLDMIGGEANVTDATRDRAAAELKRLDDARKELRGALVAMMGGAIADAIREYRRQYVGV